MRKALLTILIAALVLTGGIAIAQDQSAEIEGRTKDTLATLQATQDRAIKQVQTNGVYIRGFMAGQAARDQELIEAKLLDAKKVKKWQKNQK